MKMMEKSNDLISRADAIEAVKNTILKRFNLADWYVEMLNCGVEIEGIINSLPSASVETEMSLPKWIPCSERLPDERQDVYVTVLWDDYGDYITAYGMRTKFGWNLHSNAEGELIKGYTVVAWMPLPKPYGEREGE